MSKYGEYRMLARQLALLVELIRAKSWRVESQTLHLNGHNFLLTRLADGRTVIEVK